MTQPSAPRYGIRARIRHLRVLLGVSLVVAVLGAGVAILAGGWVAALGFALGVVLVAASYTASTLAIAWADSVNSQLVFPVGVGMYVTKFSLLMILLIQVGDGDWAGKIPMSAGIVLAVVGWTTAQIWWTVRTSHPYAKAQN